MMVCRILFPMLTLFVSAIVTSPLLAQQDDHIYYGSRSGMHLTTIKKEGINSDNAIIYIKHTPKDAKAFCVGYESDYSMDCVHRTLAEVKIADRVYGNCKEKMWVDMYGEKYSLIRPATPNDNIMADNIIVNVNTNEILDGSSASGYEIQYIIFSQLCPNEVK